MSKSTIRGDFKDAVIIGGVRMPLGFFEEAVLRIVSSLDDVVTTHYIREKIDETFGGNTSTGGIYTALQRLERDKLVSFFKSDPFPVRGGKAMNIYSITALGWAALAEQERRHELLRSLSGSRPVPKKEIPTPNPPRR